MKLLKGVTVSILLFLLCIVAPFNIYAAQETIIVPTWYSSSVQQEWQSKVQVKNYCEGTNSSTASCQLTFNVNGNYYGYIYFDGYHDNQFILDYQPVFISGGQGKYYYNIYQNAIIDINKVSIQGLNLVTPLDSIDFTQIVDLLTSINSYNQHAVGNQATQIQQLQTVINDLVISNGYLETLTELRNWNIPIESYSAIIYPIQHYDTYMYNQVNNYTYPTFNIKNGDVVFQRLNYNYETYRWIFITSENMANIDFNNPSTLYNFFKMYDGAGNELEFEFTSYTGIDRSLVIGATVGKLVSVEFKVKGIHLDFYKCKYVYSRDMIYIPIYLNVNTSKYISTDFALQFGLSNRLLDNLDIIAQGTTASNQQSSDLSSGTDSMQQQMNSFTAQEDSYNQQMNNSINAIDFTSPVSQNAGILPAANFVISIFNGLIQNNAFSVLILIVCVLIIGKKVIGK